MPAAEPICWPLRRTRCRPRQTPSVRPSPGAQLAMAAVLALCGCHRPHAAPRHAVLPSEAISAAAGLAAQGQAPLGLVGLTEVVCGRAGEAQYLPPHFSERAQMGTDVRLVAAWVDAWDLAGRPEGAKRAVAACYGGAPISLLLAAAIADSAGNWSEAVTVASQRPKDAPETLLAELALRHAVALLHLGRGQQATCELEQAISRAPEHVGLKLALAQAALANNDPVGVGAALWPLLSLPTAIDEPLLARARALLQAAREAAAPALTHADVAEQKDLMRLASSPDLSPDDLAHVHEVAKHSLQPQLYSWCALILLKRGELARGRALLEAAKGALPLDPLPARLYAAHKLSADDPGAALTLLLEAVRRDPFDVETQASLASCAARVGAWSLAVAAYEALTRMVPGSAAVHEGLAHARQMLAQP